MSAFIKHARIHPHLRYKNMLFLKAKGSTAKPIAWKSLNEASSLKKILLSEQTNRKDFNLISFWALDAL